MSQPRPTASASASNETVTAYPARAAVPTTAGLPPSALTSPTWRVARRTFDDDAISTDSSDDDDGGGGKGNETLPEAPGAAGTVAASTAQLPAMVAAPSRLAARVAARQAAADDRTAAATGASLNVRPRVPWDSKQARWGRFTGSCGGGAGGVSVSESEESSLSEEEDSESDGELRIIGV